MEERQLTLFVISPEAEIVLILVRSITWIPLDKILVMLGRNEEEDQWVCCVQASQLSLSSLYSYFA